MVLTTVPKSQVGYGSSSDPEPNHCNWSYHTKSQTGIIGPVIPPKPRSSKFSSLAPNKYLSSDRIMIWLIRILCSFMHSFTSRFQICNLTNIRWVVIENPQTGLEISRYITAILRILVGSQIWKPEVTEHIKLHNLCINHVTIWSELRYLIGAIVEGTARWNHGPVRVSLKTPRFMSGQGKKLALVTQVRFLGGSWPGPGPAVRFEPRLQPANPELLLPLEKHILLWYAQCQLCIADTCY